MSWAKLDHGFFRHPKVAGLSASSKVLYLASVCWSAEQLTDGLIPAAIAKQLCGLVDAPRKSTAELVTAGLWEETAGGWTIHDYADWQETATAVKARRAATNLRVKRHYERVTNAVTPAVTNGKLTRQDVDIDVDVDKASSSSSSHLHNGRETTKSEEEEDLYLSEAKRRLSARGLRGPVVNDPSAWLATTVRSLKDEGWQPSVPPPYHTPFDAKPECATCDSTGWAPYDPLRPILGVRPCPTCHT